jgi:hypothetical protein
MTHLAVVMVWIFVLTSCAAPATPVAMPIPTSMSIPSPSNMPARLLFVCCRR